MVHVVFAEVVLGEVRDVGLLDVRYVRRLDESDIHDDCLGNEIEHSPLVGESIYLEQSNAG